MKDFARNVILSMVGILAVGAVRWLISATISPDLPSTYRTWQGSKLYIMHPFDKRGEMEQGIARIAFYSLVRVGKGFLLAVMIGTPLGFMLGLSKTFFRMFDPTIQ